MHNDGAPRAEYDAENAALSSGTEKETQLALNLRWVDDGRYQPSLTAEFTTADGSDVTCATNDFRPLVRYTG